MIQSVRREAQDLQILLFSATFNERVKTFALKVVGPEANQVFVPKENLSLDVIKQYRVVLLCPPSHYWHQPLAHHSTPPSQGSN